MVGVFFLGSYITGLIMGMGLLDVIRGAKKIIVLSPLSLQTMILRGMVRKYIDGIYVMIMHPPKLAEGERDEVGGS